MILIPAYGRDYTSIQSLRQDWNDERDFKILNGPYCSKQDFPKLIAEDGWVEIKYAKRMKSVLVGKDGKIP